MSGGMRLAGERVLVPLIIQAVLLAPTPGYSAHNHASRVFLATTSRVAPAGQQGHHEHAAASGALCRLWLPQPQDCEGELGLGTSV